MNKASKSSASEIQLQAGIEDVACWVVLLSIVRLLLEVLAPFGILQTEDQSPDSRLPARPNLPALAVALL